MEELGEGMRNLTNFVKSIIVGLSSKRGMGFEVMTGGYSGRFRNAPWKAFCRRYFEFMKYWAT
jgi:hypothetical protein